MGHIAEINWNLRDVSWIAGGKEDRRRIKSKKKEETLEYKYPFRFCQLWNGVQGQRQSHGGRASHRRQRELQRAQVTRHTPPHMPPSAQLHPNGLRRNSTTASCRSLQGELSPSFKQLGWRSAAFSNHQRTQ